MMGVCHICGASGKLSYEHVPPHSAFNAWRIRRVGTPTTVTFRGDKEHFPTEKEAYIWLVTKFFDAYPRLLQDNSILEGREVNYFSRSPQALSPKIAEQAHYYAPIILSSGKWFVTVKLDNTQKHQILSNMAKHIHAGLVEGTDWSWHNASVKATRTQRSEALARAISEIEL
jgi:hypothetical protein